MNTAKRSNPRKRNAERTRELILSAAIRHFVEHGYAGARVDLIIQEAGFNKSLLYQHFQSKHRLFIAVLESIYERYRDQRDNIKITGLSPLDALSRITIQTFDAMHDMPEVISILNTENLYKGVHIKASKNIKPLYNPFLKALRTVLIEGEQKKIFRPGIDATQLYISLSSLAYHFFSNKYTLSAALNAHLHTPSSIKKRRADIVQMVLRYCLRPECIKGLNSYTGAIPSRSDNNRGGRKRMLAAPELQ